MCVESGGGGGGVHKFQKVSYKKKLIFYSTYSLVAKIRSYSSGNYLQVKYKTMQ